MADEKATLEPLTVGRWLRLRLKADKFRQTHLAAALGVDRSQLNHWLDGEERIPPSYYTDIRNELSLDDDAFKNFVELASADEKAGDFSKMVQKITKAPLDADAVAERLKDYCRFLASSDEELYGGYEPAVHAHISAAHKVLRCLDRAIKRDDGQLITPSDIYLHLTYPMLYYFVFFAEKLLPNDGSGAHAVRRKILTFFKERADDPRTGNPAQDMLRAHSIHMACRFEAQFDAGRLASKYGAEVEERRMALFGDAYREPNYDTADRLVHTLENDAVLRQCAFVFDGVHYGDARIKSEWPRAVPSAPRTMTRHITNILNERRAPFRRLAQARLRLLLQHGNVRPADNLPLLGRFRKLQQSLAESHDGGAQNLLDEVDKVIASTS